MVQRRVLFAVTLLAASLAEGQGRADTELKIDAFTGMGSANAQGGFAQTEMAAVRLTPSGASSYQVTKVRLLFTGGTNGTKRMVILHIYDDPSGSTTPGPELYMDEFELTASDSAYNEITPATSVTVTRPFRVAIELEARGVPSVATDLDSATPTFPGENFIKGCDPLSDPNFCDPPADPLEWRRSIDWAPISGDFIIRADVLPAGGPMPDAAPGPDSAPGGPDAAPGSPDASPPGGDCTVNTDCPIGQYCGAGNRCTLDRSE